MIPEFPQFKKLTLEDNDAVEAFTRKFPYYSDYNFTSLWCWDTDRKRELSILNDNLVVKFTDYETGDPFLSYLGMYNNNSTIETLLEHSESIGLPKSLRLMPEIAVYDINEAEFTIAADRDNFDYIYLTERLSKLAGNQYKSKRRESLSFIEYHPASKFLVLPLTDQAAQTAIREIASGWRNHSTHGDDQSIHHETEAIENIFELAKARTLVAAFLEEDSALTAFTIEEILNNIMSLGHFWKTASPSEGAYEYLASKTAEYLDDQEVTYWNWEQDLGIENLRASKSSYRPSDFLKKFTVTRRLP